MIDSIPADSSGGLLLSAPVPLENWRFVAGKQGVTLDQTWKLLPAQEPVLACSGEPYGYLRTHKSYKDFELSLEWRFVKDAAGNSGILLFTADEDRVWPSCLQIQLLQSELGAALPNGAQKVVQVIQHQRATPRPVNQWNEATINSVDGTVTVTVNGQLISEVSGCEPRSGAVALQSEGAEIEFRNLKIRELKQGTRIYQSRKLRNRVRMQG